MFLRRCVNVASLLLHLRHLCSQKVQYWRRRNAEVAQMQLSVNQALVSYILSLFNVKWGRYSFLFFY